jgi:hypothetical protein
MARSLRDIETLGLENIWNWGHSPFSQIRNKPEQCGRDYSKADRRNKLDTFEIDVCNF